MKTAFSAVRVLRALCAVACVSMFSALAAEAQVPAHRLAQSFNSAVDTELPNTFNQRTAKAAVQGHLDGQTQLPAMMMVLKPTAQQDATLDQLLADQQNPSSPLYHKWLTPSQFGAQFGVSDADLAVLKQWLTTEGFQVVSVPESRNAIVFSGTAAQVERSFKTTMQRYSGGGQQFFQNSSNIHVPAALSGIIAGVANLSNYKPQHFSKIRPVESSSSTIAPMYNNSGTTVTHSLSPWDFQQIYGMRSLVNAGYTGSGIKIAVLGQSAVSTTQIANFQTLTGQTQKAPTMVLVGGSNTATSGDEGESEVDIEYAGGTAPGASIYFVYDTYNGVFNALLTAITQNIAPILTMSYGSCEITEALASGSSSSDVSVIEPYLRQANAQGQTVIVSSGDWNAATCDEFQQNGDFTTATQGATVSYPASSPYVTGIGGTTLNEGSGSYWAASNNSQAGSATGYIPEIVWNDTSANSGTVLGTGGGASRVFSKPSWQVATGVPNDGQRDVPDVAFNSAVYHDAYLYCSAESTAEACTTTSFPAYRIGGTSLAAPNFAAMLAVIESANGGARLGNINPSLYRIYATTPTAFQDVTSGNNQVACVAGTDNCPSGTLGYSAGVGYDQTTGLGSVNAAVLQTALAGLGSLVNTPAVTLTQSLPYASVGQSISFTVNVSGTGVAAPTGTVAISVDGGTPTSYPLTAGSNNTSSYTYTLSSGFSSTGSHTVTAVYSGDANYLTATSSITPYVYPASTGSFTITPSPSTLTITNGSTGTETFTLTSTGGFTDTVNFALSGNAPSTITELCYTTLGAPVPANGTGTATVTFYTTAQICEASNAVVVPLVKRTAKNDAPSTFHKMPVIVFAGLLIGCFGVRRRRMLRTVLVLCLTISAIGVIGCGSSQTGSPSTSGSNTGTFTVTVKGTANRNASITAQSTFTLTLK